MNKCDVLIFAEDPGAANFVASLPCELETRKLSTVLLSGGLSSRVFAARNLSFVEVDSRSAKASELIRRYSPRIIVGGTAENTSTLSLALFEESRSHEIPTIGVVDLAVNADRRFKGCMNSALFYAPEYIMVPDKQIWDAFVGLGFPSERLTIIGYPQYDYAQAHKDKVLASRSVHASPRIVFISEPESKLNPALSRRNANYTFQGRGSNQFKTKIVLEEILDAVKDVGLTAKIIVRLHPKNIASEFSEYEHEIVEVSQNGDPYQVLLSADLIVGMTSMLLQESAWLGKPTLAVLPEERDREKLASIYSGLTPSVTSRDQLIQALKRFKDGNWTVADPSRFFEPGASKRMADFIGAIAAQRSSL